jgi:hypothetical protein
MRAVTGSPRASLSGKRRSCAGSEGLAGRRPAPAPSHSTTPRRIRSQRLEVEMWRMRNSLRGAMSSIALGAAETTGATEHGHVVVSNSISSGCHASDVGLASDIFGLQEIVSGTDSMSADQRASFNLPTLPRDSVTAVTDSTICNRAALAFGRNLTPPDTITARTVYVIRVGPTRYTVADSAVTRGEFTITFVFDSAFTTKLAAIAN